MIYFQAEFAIEVKTARDKPFVPKFIEHALPPTGSRRRNPFPHDKNELTLAIAWKFAEQGQDVLIYTPVRGSVETIGNTVVDAIRHGVLRPLRSVTSNIENAMLTGIEWLGEDHPAVKCLKFGVVLHHGGLPRAYLTEVESLMRSGDCCITIASPTLAQGLNLSASVLIIPSLWRNNKIITSNEFANVVGRAGRAFVDLEGLILHVVWEKPKYNQKKASRREIEKAVKRAEWGARQAVINWDNLVFESSLPPIKSGILSLAEKLFSTVCQMTKLPQSEVIEFITGHWDSWDFSELTQLESVELDVEEMERYLASLDAALLALLDTEIIEEDVEQELINVLEGSLFSRQITALDQTLQGYVKQFISIRAHRIWATTSPNQRRGYHLACVGLKAGRHIDDSIGQLARLLVSAEQAILSQAHDQAVDFIIELANIVFQIHPFRPIKGMPNAWELALKKWLLGDSSSEVMSTIEDEERNLLQEILTYRLPWAMEAIRTHGIALGLEELTNLQGLVPAAVSAGSMNRSVITLIRAGLASRDAAKMAVESTDAVFVNYSEMIDWLSSELVLENSIKPDWPSSESRHSWVKFHTGNRRQRNLRWVHKSQKIQVQWISLQPEIGADVVIIVEGERNKKIILSPNMQILGYFEEDLVSELKYITTSKVSSDRSSVAVEYFCPFDT